LSDPEANQQIQGVFTRKDIAKDYLIHECDITGVEIRRRTFLNWGNGTVSIIDTSTNFRWELNDDYGNWLAEEKKKEELRRQALQKLTQEEREALGIRVSQPKSLHFVQWEHELGSGGWAFSDGHIRLDNDPESACLPDCPGCRGVG
jgi:hypothetical protein